MDISTKEQEYLDKFSERKSRLRMNLIEFIVWIILLSFAFNYLKSNPAERTSMFAWIEVLFQRAEVFVTNLFWDDWNLLQDKHQLERYYKELISTMENGECATRNTLDSAKEKYRDLLSMNVETYKANLQVYQGYAWTYAAKIKENCWE